MSFGQYRVSRRFLFLTAAVIGFASLAALGANAAFNKKAMMAAERAAATQQVAFAVTDGRKIALVIGNGHYPDAAKPLAQPINDARALTGALRHDGFNVDVIEDASRDDMNRALDRLTAQIKPDSTVLLFFGGYAVQAGRENYMIPVDAAIWRDIDVRRQGLSVEAVLNAVQARGARAKLVVIDASRRNPYERRFRSYSHGLAPIDAPNNSLVLSSTAPGKVADDSGTPNSRLVTALLDNLRIKGATAQSVFSKTRLAVSQASNGGQVPAMSSSLQDDVPLGGGIDVAEQRTGG